MIRVLYGSGVGDRDPQAKLVNEFEVPFVCLFVSAVSQWWISPFKMVNEYSRSPDFCLLVHKA